MTRTVSVAEIQRKALLYKCLSKTVLLGRNIIYFQQRRVHISERNRIEAARIDLEQWLELRYFWNKALN